MILTVITALLINSNIKLGCANTAERAVDHFVSAILRNDINSYKKTLHKRLVILNYVKHFTTNWSTYNKNGKLIKPNEFSEVEATKIAEQVYSNILKFVKNGKHPYFANKNCTLESKKTYPFTVLIDYKCRSIDSNISCTHT